MNKGLSRLAVVVAVFALLGSSLYKWVDDKGVTHYSDKPPPTGKAEEIKAPPVAMPSKDPSTPSGRSWQQKEEEFQQRRAAREAAEQELAKQEAAVREQVRVKNYRCLAARHNLHALLMERPVYTLDQRGERVYMSDEQRPAAIALVKKDIELYCPAN